MAQQQVENLPAWFTEVSRFGEKGEYDRALKVVNRSKRLFCYLWDTHQVEASPGGYCKTRACLDAGFCGLLL